MHVEHAVTKVHSGVSLIIHCTNKPDKMRGFQCLLLCALLYLASVDAFGICVGEADDGSGPDNATVLNASVKKALMRSMYRA